MSNIQIVTDSTAYFTKEEAKKYNIVVVPLSVCFEGEEFQEGFLDETGDFLNDWKGLRIFQPPLNLLPVPLPVCTMRP